MIGRKSLLNNYVKKDGPKVTFGDSSKRTVKGLGTIKCKTIVIKEKSLTQRTQSCSLLSGRTTFTCFNFIFVCQILIHVLFTFLLHFLVLMYIIYMIFVSYSVYKNNFSIYKIKIYSLAYQRSIHSVLV